MGVQLDEARIQEIVERVVARLGPQKSPAQAVQDAKDPPPPQAPKQQKTLNIPSGRMGAFPDVDSAVAATRKAFEQWERMHLETRYQVAEAIRKAARANLQGRAEHAVAEIGKNTLAIEKTPGPGWLRVDCYTGDNGLMMTERAPYGVIGAITPCTNAT